MIQAAPLGDSALVLSVDDDSRGRPEKLSQRLLAARNAIRAARIPGVIECSSSYSSIGVFYDPVAVSAASAGADNLAAWLSDQLIAAAGRGRGKGGIASRAIDVPVCFDPEFALDLGELAEHAGRSEGEAIALFCAKPYRVCAIGFMPGFPYLEGLPDALQMPRRATPREKVAAGSVAIGGNHAGIYPLPSPGGWNLIGRTPLRLFDPGRETPALFRPGDTVRFRPFARAKFDRALAEVGPP